MADETYEPLIIGFLCNWCSYAGADLAGASRLKYPPNLKIIRVPCSGRVSPELVMRTFREGADGVMVLGCHIGDCHYSTGNHRTARRIPVLKALLEFTGIPRERFLAKWVSASEGGLFVETVKEFTETVRSLPPMRRVLKEAEPGAAREEG
jgi:F420-non-reducing hydrogenase iron-sulfur subunit